jgi:hypothetical protein
MYPGFLLPQEKVAGLRVVIAGAPIGHSQKLLDLAGT